MHRKAWVGLVLAALIAPASGSDAPEKPPRTQERPAPATAEEIEGLVRALGADAWADREAATHRLVEIGRPAHAAVKAALASDDAEVRYRARLVLRSSLRKVKQLLDRISRTGGSP